MKQLLYTESSESEREIEEPSESESEGEQPVAAKDLKVDSFVIVIYDGQHFPGQVVDLEKTKVTVRCMSKAGPTAWKWPAHEDIHAYPLVDIRSIISPPTPCGRRGQWSVPEVEKYW